MTTNVNEHAWMARNENLHSRNRSKRIPHYFAIFVVSHYILHFLVYQFSCLLNERCL